MSRTITINVLIPAFLATLIGCGVAQEPALGGAISAGSDVETDVETAQTALEEALPTAADLNVNLPAAAGSKPGTIEAALVNSTSELWWHTATTAANMHRGLAHILGPIVFVTNNVEPVFTGKNKAVWYGSSPLDPQEHLLVVRRKMLGYRFAVLARLKTQSGDPEAWRLRIAGRWFPNADDDGGHGRVWVDMDTDLNPNTKGKVLAHWARGDGQREISAFMFAFSDDGVATTNQAAHFQSEADGSGLLVHGIQGFDINDGEPGKEAKENAIMIGRWTADGDGRGDLIATGGDVASEGLEAAAMTQCWLAPSFDTSFEAVHAKVEGEEPVLVKADGDFATCVFPEAADPVPLDAGEIPNVEDEDIPEEAAML